MMKLVSCLLLLATVVDVRVKSFVIYPSPVPTSEPRNVTRNDPRCQGRNGLFPNPDNCKAYYACSNGTGQDRFCPEGMTFHNIKHCTFDENSGCEGFDKVTTPRVPCPEFYGIFPDPEDCQKYIICSEYMPTEHSCPENQWYKDIVGGCVEADRCPQ